MAFILSFVLKVRVSNPQRLTYTQILDKDSLSPNWVADPARSRVRHMNFKRTIFKNRIGQVWTVCYTEVVQAQNLFYVKIKPASKLCISIGERNHKCTRVRDNPFACRSRVTFKRYGLHEGLWILCRPDKLRLGLQGRTFKIKWKITNRFLLLLFLLSNGTFFKKRDNRCSFMLP